MSMGATLHVYSQSCTALVCWSFPQSRVGIITTNHHVDHTSVQSTTALNCQFNGRQQRKGVSRPHTSRKNRSPRERPAHRPTRPRSAPAVAHAPARGASHGAAALLVVVEPDRESPAGRGGGLAKGGLASTASCLCCLCFSKSLLFTAKTLTSKRRLGARAG